MSSYVVGALIGAGGAILGSVLTLTHDHVARKADERERRKTVLRQALSNYLFALDTATLELESGPSKPSSSRLDRIVERVLQWIGLASGLELLARLLQRGVYGKRHAEVIDRLARASAALRLVAPSEVEAQMQAVDELFRRWSAGDENWQVEWRLLREQVRTHFRMAVLPSAP